MRKWWLVGFLLCMWMVGTGSLSAEEKSNQWIIINKSINKLAFYEDGKLVKEFPVATGKQQTYTPEGTFKIVNKIKNRPYYTKNIPGGDPRNPLGDRWLGLNARNTPGNTYGIHGNNNENSIGKYVSLGCVRMHNKDVRWLFDQVKTGTTVVITRSDLSFDELSEKHQFALAPEPIEKIDATIALLSKTQLYRDRNSQKKTPHALAPQNVTAFEQSGNWYHIKTWIGDAWIKGDHIAPGNVQPVQQKIVVTNRTLINDQPLTGRKVLGAIAPQTVEAFEQWGDWYRIRSWIGDVWIKGPFSVADTGSPLAYEQVVPEQMTDEIKTWTAAQSEAFQPDAKKWGDHWYVFVPHGIISAIWEMQGEITVKGRTVDPASTPELVPPDLLARLTEGTEAQTVKFELQ